ncbi:serine/threonine protein kinase [Aestuariimicrobium ganziense]|uniref:serine/threonine protein kinase n=1 Tax=Aestuariimicrobium ganziense TaxID=2773677 RepID=UPI0019431B81|nr:serine/threonine-protein kinase [Aestuariimicrobium ganziense]
MATWKKLARLKVTGQGEIYRVQNQETGELAIMKRLLKSPQLADSDGEMRRFRREVRSQNAMEHEGIMPILGWNFEADPPFYLMPEAEMTLEDLIERNPSGVGPTEAAEIILTVIDTIAYAHAQGIYHRDLKPANILRLDGHWVVGDFGMCRDLSTDSTTITRPNTIVGTVAYVAPEQYDDGHAIEASADVYALGKVFIHLLTGRRPFPYTQLEYVPAEYKYLLTKALAERPADRHATVAEFGRQIELVAAKSDTLRSVEDRGKDLLSRGIKGDTGATAELLALLLAEAGDEALYTSFVAKLPEPMLAAMQATNKPAFEELIKTFNEYSEGGHPFNYVDVIADFFAMVYRIAENAMIRRLALHRIMTVGASHNRFYVGEVFARLVSSVKDPNEILMAADVMREDRTAAHWYSGYFTAKHALPRQIREILDEAA